MRERERESGWEIGVSREAALESGLMDGVVWKAARRALFVRVSHLFVSPNRV